MFPIKIPENKRTTVNTLAVLVIVLSLASMFLSRRQPTLDMSDIAIGVHEAMGRRAALETGKLLGHEGKVVVVTVDAGPSPIPFAEEEISSFIQAVGQTGGVV